MNQRTDGRNKGILWIKLVKGKKVPIIGRVKGGQINGRDVRKETIVFIEGLTPEIKVGEWLKVEVIGISRNSIIVAPMEFRTDSGTRRRLATPRVIGKVRSFPASTLQEAKRMFAEEETRLRKEQPVVEPLKTDSLPPRRRYPRADRTRSKPRPNTTCVGKLMQTQL